MPRPEKVQAVEDIKARFAEADASFITEYRGLTVTQQQDLRNALRQAGATYKVLKMTLTRRAIDELGHNELEEFLSGPTAIAFAGGDPVPVAKALKDFGAEHEALVVKAGWLNGEVLLPETVAKLASIESRDVLLAKIAGAAKAPLTKLAGMLGSLNRDAASMFSQLLEKKEQDAPAPAAEEESDAAEDPEAADTVADEGADDTASPEASDDAASDDEAPAEAEADEAPADAEADEVPAAEADSDAGDEDDQEPAAEATDDDGDGATTDDADDDGADEDGADADEAPAEEE